MPNKYFQTFFFITKPFFLFKGEETDSCYTNLFYPLDKHFGREIENSTHPLIIALIMRRSTGIQALECHLLITRQPCVAKSVVEAINGVCDKYKVNQNKNTNVFQYSPYTSFSNSEKNSETTSHHLKSMSTRFDNNTNTVITSTPPIPIRNKPKSNLDPAKVLPPKSPFNQSSRPHKASNVQTNIQDKSATYDNNLRNLNTYVENKIAENERKNELESKSVTNVSLFSKLKSLKNKNSQEEGTKTPKMSKKKESKNLLFSTSAIDFVEDKTKNKMTPQKTILKKPSTEFELTPKSIRSSSAFGNLSNNDRLTTGKLL